MFKKTSLTVFAFAVCAAFLLLPDYSNAQDIPGGVANQSENINAEDVLDKSQSATSDEPILEICKMYSSGSMDSEVIDADIDYKFTLKFFVEINTKERCSVRSEAYTHHRGKSVTDTNHIEIAYFQNTGDKRELCQTGIDPKTGTLKSSCYLYPDYSESNKEEAIPSSGGFTEEADLPKPTVPVVTKTVKKGEYREIPLSEELLALFDPEDRTDPQIYSYTVDSMSGFPPMGLILWADGVLKGTPVGKDSSFRACVTNVSGKKVCKIIEVDVQSEETDKPELNPDKLTKLAYEGLTFGQQVRSGIRERVAIVKPDGSIMYMDKNSILTPVSEFEVKTDTGRFRFDYQPATGGGCGPIGESPTWACRQVNTPNGTIRIKGTEFTVENDSSGTSIAVIEGTVLVSDTEGKKEVEINKGQFAFLKNGILSGDPQSFEPDQLDRWWEEEDAKQGDKKNIVTIMLIIFGVVALILLVVIIIKKIVKKKM